MSYEEEARLAINGISQDDCIIADRQHSDDMNTDLILKLTDELEAKDKCIGVLKQTVAEVRHAQNQGSGWYTHGDSGLFLQVRMWLDRADKAINELTKVKPVNNERGERL